MRQRKKTWADPFLATHQDLVLPLVESNQIQWGKVFGRTAPILVEIGVGKGNFITSMARNHPERDYIGVEHQLSVLAIAAKKVWEQGLTNVRLLQMDGAKLGEIIPPLSLEAIYLNFSDPWPKARHIKRRLTSPYFTKMYENLLIPSGKIIMKTDNDLLYAFSLEQFAIAPWRIISQSFDYSALDFDDYETEYEQRFRTMNQTIHRLVVEKGEMK